MPRPKRPRLTGAFDFEEQLSEAIDRESDDPDYLLVKAEATRLVENYCKAWKGGSKPGRRSIMERDELIVKLSKVFHTGAARSVGHDSDPKEYQASLITFLMLMLVAYDIKVSAVGLLDKVPAKYRQPRD